MSVKKVALIGCGGVVGLFAIGVISLIIWMFTGPEGGVRVSNTMEPYAVEYLEKNQVLDDDEDLLAYYDVTISLSSKVAAIVTTKRVIYHKDGQNTALELADVNDIRHRKEPLIGDIIEISSVSGAPMVIEIAPLNQGETFKNVLFDAWKKATGQ